MQRISIASVRQPFGLEKAARARRMALLAVCGSAFCTGLVAHAATIDLGTASGFAFISVAGATSTGATVINGDVGSMTSYVWGDAVVNGVIHAINDADTIKARDDARSAYNTIASLGLGTVLTGDLGGRTLTPGVYSFDSAAASLTGKLTLDGLGQTNPEFIFKIGSTLTTASYSEIYAFNGAVDWNVFFQVGSSATLGTYTKFIGTILADQSITLTTGATVLNGGLFALGAAVVLDSNTIGAVPEPASAALVIAGLALIATFRKRAKLKRAEDCETVRL
jgi:hypothetical protein